MRTETKIKIVDFEETLLHSPLLDLQNIFRKTRTRTKS